MKVTKVFMAVAVAGGVAGCGIGAKIDARNEYQASRAAYKACLAVHPEDAKSACEGQRLAMEVDERAYNNFAAGITAGGNRTYNVNSQAR